MPDEFEKQVKQEGLDAAIRIARRDAKDIQKEPKIFFGRLLGLAEGRNTFYDINKLSNDRGLGLSTSEIEKIINDSYQEFELPNKFDALTLPKKYTKQMQTNRNKEQDGGLLSDDRKKFVFGTLATKAGQLISKKLAPTEIKNLEKLLLDKKYSELGAPTFTKKELNKIKNESDSDAYKDFLREFATVKQNDYDYIDNAKKLGLSNEGIINLLKKSDKDIKNELKKLDINPKRNSLNVGGELQNPEKADLDNDGELSSYEEARGKAIEENMREPKQVGGMMMDDQMADMMQREELPALDNQMADMMPEEKTAEQKAIEEAQAPDEKMEENYVDFLIDEALSDDEEAMLMQELQANPQLSMLFDKVMEVAMEFSGSGPVEGPGSEVSDSIPARLSDGEFVFTAKSVDVLGADNLMQLMKQAEAQADGRQMAQDGGLMEEEETVMPVEQQPVRQDIRVTKETVDSQAAMQDEEDLVGDEIKKSMLSGRPHVRS